MNVYDEYVKNQGSGAGGSDETGGATTNGGTENMNPSAEEVKDPNAP